MAKEIKLPELGENIETAGVITVLVKPGDKIEKDQGILEIETDKATIEVPSEVTGVIKDVLVKPGDQIKVGQTLIIVEDSSENIKPDGLEKVKQKGKQSESNEQPNEEKPEPDTKKEKTEETAAPVVSKSSQGEILEIALPELGENIESADILNVLVKEGDSLEKDQSIIEIETDKATIEVPSTVAGKITEVLVKQGEKAKVGQVLLKVQSEGATQEAAKQITKQEESPKSKETAEETKSDKQAPQEIQKTAEADGRRESFQPGEIDQQPPIIKNAAPAAPSVRRLARELGVDINKVTGTGANNRISLQDVKEFVKKINEQLAGGRQGLNIKQEALPDFTKYGKIERKPMSKIRTVTADHLSYAWSSIPHVTQHDKADITELEEIRKKLNPKVEEAGSKLTVTGILVMIAVAGLKKFPQFNSSIDMEKHEVIYKDYFNIGIAVDTENGLMVPVIKNADRKSLIEVSLEMNSLAEKSRNRKVSLEDLQGGCFTITNLGGIGGTYFTPIVNAPEVAILGVSRGSFEPVFNEGEFIPRLMLPLSLSYDHRIIDGADAARFLRWVCETLEQPFNLILE